MHIERWIVVKDMVAHRGYCESYDFYDNGQYTFITDDPQYNSHIGLYHYQNETNTMFLTVSEKGRFDKHNPTSKYCIQLTEEVPPQNATSGSYYYRIYLNWEKDTDGNYYPDETKTHKISWMPYIIRKPSSRSAFGQCPKPEYYYVERCGGSSVDNHRIREVKKENLQKINENYYKDQNYVYYNYRVDMGSSRSCIVETFYLIENADPKTFEIYEKENFSRDKNNVYYIGFPIKNADLKTFTPLSSYYAKDNARIFFKNCEIKDADLQTFKVIDGRYADSYAAYDKNFIYYKYNKEKIDFETFVVDEEWGYKDWHFRDKNYNYRLRSTGYSDCIEKEKIKKR